MVNLTNWDYNIPVCIGLDGLQLLFTLVAYTVLASTLYIIDRFFNSHYVIRRKVRRTADSSQYARTLSNSVLSSGRCHEIFCPPEIN